jgi:hypothetical protein
MTRDGTIFLKYQGAQRLNLRTAFNRSFWAKLEFSQTRTFVWFSTFIFPFYKMLFMSRREFSCFVDFFVCIFKPELEYGFLKNPLVEGTVNQDFCQVNVQGSVRQLYSYSIPSLLDCRLTGFC